MSQISNAKQQIVGAWRLLSYVLTKDDGETIPLWGERADGMIIYLDNGYMSVHVCDRDRPTFAEDDFLCGRHDEIKKAFEGYTGYFGTYEYYPEKNLVLHHVAESLYPNWSGLTHSRFIERNGDTLVIKTPPVRDNNHACVMALQWQRV